MASVLWWRELLQTAYRTGYLTRAALPRLAYSIERLGLHPEQVFIGMGFVGVSQYAELVERCFHISLESIDRESIQGIKALPWNGSIELATEQGDCLAASDLWARSEQDERELRVYADERRLRLVPVFRADIEVVTPFSSSGVEAGVERVLKEEQSSWQWMPERDRVQVWRAHETINQLPAWAWPATGEALMHVLPDHRLQKEETVHGLAMELMPGLDRLPWQHHAVWRDFLKSPAGICLVIGAPRATVLQLKRAVSHHDAHEPTPEKSVRFVHSEEELMRVWPHLLAGDPALLTVPAFSEQGWDRLRWSQMPVLVIQHWHARQPSLDTAEHGILIHHLSV